MSEIAETLQDPIEQGSKNKLNSAVAVMVAVSATFMAICNVKDGNIVQAMSQAQAHSIDSWSYYQAKSTKQSITENTLEMIKLQKAPGNDSVIAKYESEVKRYEKEKADIKNEAEGHAKEYDDLNVFDD